MKPPSVFTLENFEGPLDFLLHLIYQNEIDIYEVPILKIMTQYLERQAKNGEEQEENDVDSGAEFIGMASLLLFLKSRMLLPKHEQPLKLEEDADPRFDIIHQLIDYCRFKEAAKELSIREDQQSGYYGRGLEGPYTIQKNLGIEHLTLTDLKLLFQEIANKVNANKGTIDEEVWLVGDKIVFIRKSLIISDLLFEDLFSLNLSKDELIVTFLALLELMKLGEVVVIKDAGQIIVKRGNLTNG